MTNNKIYYIAGVDFGRTAIKITYQKVNPSNPQDTTGSPKFVSYDYGTYLRDFPCTHLGPKKTVKSDSNKYTRGGLPQQFELISHRQIIKTMNRLDILSIKDNEELDLEWNRRVNNFFTIIHKYCWAYCEELKIHSGSYYTTFPMGWMSKMQAVSAPDIFNRNGSIIPVSNSFEAILSPIIAFGVCEGTVLVVDFGAESIRYSTFNIDDMSRPCFQKFHSIKLGANIIQRLLLNHFKSNNYDQYEKLHLQLNEDLKSKYGFSPNYFPIPQIGFDQMLEDNLGSLKKRMLEQGQFRIDDDIRYLFRDGIFETHLEYDFTGFEEPLKGYYQAIENHLNQLKKDLSKFHLTPNCVILSGGGFNIPAIKERYSEAFDTSNVIIRKGTEFDVSQGLVYTISQNIQNPELVSLPKSYLF